MSEISQYTESLHEECGVFGMYDKTGETDMVSAVYSALYALQHRGQESAGIAVSNGERIMVFKDMGLVSQVFDEPTLNSLTGAKLTYTVKGTVSTIDHEVLKSWLVQDENGNYSIDESKEKTKKARRQAQRRREHEKNITPADPIPAATLIENDRLPADLSALFDDEVEPFGDIR